MECLSLSQLQTINNLWRAVKVEIRTRIRRTAALFHRYISLVVGRPWDLGFIEIVENILKHDIHVHHHSYRGSTTCKDETFLTLILFCLTFRCSTQHCYHLPQRVLQCLMVHSLGR